MKKIKFTPIVLFLFFFSGLAALIYEIVWARKLGLVFGTTNYAISTILAVFMAGLALGSFLFGKIVDRLKAPKNFLFLFALLEMGIGIYAFFTPLIFTLVEKIELVLVRNLNWGSSIFGINLIRFGLSFLALILPTTLMGGTLPVLLKFLARAKGEVGKKFAWLYSLNTFGGVAGVILAGFFLIIPLGFGVNGTIYAAAAIDSLVGLCFLGLSAIFPVDSSNYSHGLTSVEAEQRGIIEAKGRESKRELARNDSRRFASIILLGVFFFTGFVALALEVLWTRVLVMTIGSSTYAFSLILAGFLTGIALGSILISKFVERGENLWPWLALTIGLLGGSVLFLTPFFDDLPLLFLKIFGTFGDSFWLFETGVFSLIFLVLLLPTVLMGITFPLGVKIYVREIKRIGTEVGEIYSVNTLGAIFGSLAAGFLFLPAFGLRESILLCGLVYLVLAGILVWFGSSNIEAKGREYQKIEAKGREYQREFPRILKVALGLLIIILSISVFFLPRWNKYSLTSGPAVYARAYLANQKLISKKPAGEKMLFYKDGAEANVSVFESPEGFLQMRVNGKVDASAGRIEFKEIGDLDTMLLTGYLPILLYPKEPENALIVGLGGGMTLGAMTQYPSLKNIDLVEIEPAIIEGARYFKEFNHDALNNPRVRVIIEDGRNYLLLSQKKYDIISSQPSNPWVKGNANLFTREYYQLCKNHLKKDGLMFQWVQLYSLDKEDLERVLATFSNVFPYAQAWSSTNFKDLFLVGSLEPIGISQKKFDERFNIPEIKSDFAKAGISNSEEILANFIFTQKQIKNFSEGLKLHTDNYPILEFRAPLFLYKDTVSGNLKWLYSLREDIQKLFNVSLSQEAKAFQEKRLLGEIFRQQGESDKAIKAYSEALKIKTNPIVEGQLAKYFYAMGRVAALEGKQEKALSFYEKAVKFNPKEPIYLNSLGAAYLRKNDFKNAEIWLKKSTEIGYWHTWGFSNLGLLYLRQGKTEEAEKYLKKALEIDKNNTDALNWLAIIYHNRGQYEKAKELLEKSLKIRPNQPKTRERLKELE